MANPQAQDDLPPYFGINPDQAGLDLGPALGPAGFQHLAEACARGRADLVGRGLDVRGEKTLRRFSTWEITRYLIPVAPAHFRRVLRQNPDLPQGLTETDGGAKWFTLDEVLRLRERLNQIVAESTGKPFDEVKKDADRDFIMTAEQAHEYGLVDQVMDHRE